MALQSATSRICFWNLSEGDSKHDSTERLAWEGLAPPGFLGDRLSEGEPMQHWKDVPVLEFFANSRPVTSHRSDWLRIILCGLNLGSNQVGEEW